MSSNKQLAIAKKPAAEIFKRVGKDSTFAILKCPANRFLPSQADALHVDIWHEGQNIVRDAGFYKLQSNRIIYRRSWINSQP